jgi:hypothetical protein
MSAGRLDASAFVPDIDDDTLLVGEPADLVLEAGQRSLIHQANMDEATFPIFFASLDRRPSTAKKPASIPRKSAPIRPAGLRSQ